MISANENIEASSAALYNNPSIEHGKIPVVDAKAVADFRDFLEKNRDDLKTGMGAFHHDGHSNW